MNRWLLLGLAGLLAVVNPTQGFAALILGYEFTGAAPVGFQPSIAAPGVFSSTSAVAKSANLNIFELFNGTPPTVLAATPGTMVPGATLATAFSNGWYFDFNFQVAPDMMVDLTQLTFQAARGGSSTNRGFGVTTSLTGHSQANVISSVTNIPAERPAFTNYTVDLTVPAFAEAFQGLTSETGPVSFRFYIFASGNTQRVDFDNIMLSGNVTAIPEPSAFALLGILGLGVVLQGARCRTKPMV